MKSSIAIFSSKSVCLAALLFLAFSPFTSVAQVSTSINIFYNTYPGESSYYIQMPITAATNPLTYDEVISPLTNYMSSLDSNGNGSFSTYVNITQFSDLANAVTNGHWLFITDVGTPSQKTYSFQITFTNFTSNDMPGFQVTYPMPEQAITSTNVTYAWANGPVFYTGVGLTVHNTDYSFYEGVGIDPAYYSSWNFTNIGASSLQVVDGDTNFYFDVDYETSGTNYLGISTPLTTNGQAVPGWSATSTLNLTEDNATNADGDGVHFTLNTNQSSGAGAGGGHTNLVYYSFEDDNIFAYDYSGHGNSVVGVATDFASPYITNDAAAGQYSVGFLGAPGGGGWLEVPTNLVATLAGSFSASLWVRTSENRGNDSDPAQAGSGMMAANADQVVPMALTGSKLAFLTGGDTADTLHSSTSVNTGNYVHLVVTRDHITGAKKIYVNGNLDAFDVADTGLLTSSSAAALDLGIGTSLVNGFTGDMDEVQIYSGVLSSNDVAYLFSHPGTAVPDSAGQTFDAGFNAALGTTNLDWTTGGDTSWFVETTNTYPTNAAAAQSGSVTNTQASVLSITVTGPGTMTFYWSDIANDPNRDFECEFFLDTTNNDLGGDLCCGSNPWSQSQAYAIPAGQHMVGWAAFAYGDTDPTQAAFVDQVSYVADVAPVITLNPFSQTNYPGYDVALLAGASGLPAPTWQWYEVGNPNPIAGATSALFIPANSGASNVAGNYYAVASNPAGSQTTTTALVTFVSAPLPPGWSEALKSPFVNYDNYGTYTSGDKYYSCVVDSTGANIFTSGLSSGSNFFGTNRIIATNGANAAVIVKQTAAKATRWVVAVTNNGNGDAYAEGLAAAPNGGVFATGFFSGTNWLGNTLLEDSGQGTLFLASLDANGNTVWVQTISNAFPTLNCLVADPSGNVTLAAFINNSTSIGGSNLAVSGQTGILAQYNSAGTLNWEEPLSNPIMYLQYSAGRLYAGLANFFSTQTNYSVGGLTNTTDRNWTVAAMYATNGQAVWLRGVSEAKGVYPGGVLDNYPEIAVSGTNLFLVGTAYGSNAIFGSFTVPITNGRGQYFARYDTDGNAQLATGFGSPTTQPEAVVADAAGNVYVAGNFDTYSFFGSDILASPRLATLGNGFFSQAFAAKFSPTGTPQWACLAESTNETIQVTDLINFYDIALAPSGIWVCGVGSGAVYFGTNMVNSAGEYIVNGDNLIIEEFNSGMLGMISLTQPASPVTLLNPAVMGTNLQFDFLSEVGFTHNILYRTNLAIGTWLTNSTIAGDGTMKTNSIPLSVFSPSKAGFVRVSTQ